MPYKIEHPSRLSPPTLYATVEEASAEGRQAFADDGDFYVTSVRESELSDYFNVTALVGDLRENMQTRSGDSSVLDSENFVTNIGDLSVSIMQVLEAFQQLYSIDMNGLLIRGERHVIRNSKPA